MPEGAASEATGAAGIELPCGPGTDLLGAFQIGRWAWRLIHGEQCQHGPRHVAGIGRHLRAILYPYLLGIVPPPGELDGSGTDGSGGIAVSQASIVPVAIPVQRREQ